jgi:hypothetical protein
MDSKVSKRTGQRGSGKENVKLSEHSALGVDMGEVDEITDSCGEELRDKEPINLEEIEVSVDTEAETSKELQEYSKLLTTKRTHLAFLDIVDGMEGYGKKYSVLCLSC